LRDATGETAPARKPFYRVLYVQVLIAIVLGFLVGWLAPDVAPSDWVKALGDGFVKLIKMVIAPIIFCTVASGIAHIDDARKVGRVGIKALLYFEIVSTLALALGLVIGNVVKPGAGFSGAGDDAAVADYTARAAHESPVGFILNIIPDSVVGAFARGDILQVLLFAVLFGFALMALGERGRTVRALVDDLGHAFFGVIAVIMKAAPIGAFGAMAYTIGKYGPQAIGNLAGLILTFYATAAIFILVVLGIVARASGFRILQFIGYIRDEILIVLGPARRKARCRSSWRSSSGSGAPSPSSVSWCRPGTRSTSTAPTSISRWRRCSSRRRWA
jgi:aerobic C4-dicarboxylate transport protein